LTSAAFSNLSQLKEALLDHVDIDPANIFSPDGFMEKDNIYEFCRNYERQIQQVGGIDYMLLGVGYACNIGFNGPGSSANTTTRLVFMDNNSRKEASRMFNSIDNVPTSVITMGISTILKSKHII